jgi:hypothetical protein
VEVRGASSVMYFPSFCAYAGTHGRPDSALIVVTHTSAARVYKKRFQLTHGSMQNTHQAELVAPCRQEAQQWKGQCLRPEETLGEINAWKDQFL